ncbi:MAG: hypothetical protein KA125_00010 [Chromatiaceae bacterium]|nr:hypothetical protein [Chromatiaceae bacterium]
MADTASLSRPLSATSSEKDPRTEIIAALIHTQIEQQGRLPSQSPLKSGKETLDPALLAGWQDAAAALSRFPPRQAQARSVLLPLQEWEGYVTEVRQDGFTAQLVDLTADDRFPGEEADFAREDLSDTDLVLLREGAVFRWTIGYLKSPAGTKKRVSQIVFRRLPQWTKRDIAAADRNTDEFVSTIRWE